MKKKLLIQWYRLCQEYYLYNNDPWTAVIYAMKELDLIKKDA